MTKKSKKILIAVVAVVILAAIAFMYSNTTLFSGRFSVNFDQSEVLDEFPDFECDLTNATVVVSQITTKPSTRSTSEITSLVPKCMPLKLYNRWGKLWE